MVDEDVSERRAGLPFGDGFGWDLGPGGGWAPTPFILGIDDLV